MKLNKKQIQVLVSYIMKEFEAQTGIEFPKGREAAEARAISLIEGEFEKEREVEREADKMVENLERQGQQFERHKMFLMVKKKLAEQKGVVL